MEAAAAAAVAATRVGRLRNEQMDIIGVRTVFVQKVRDKRAIG